MPHDHIPSISNLTTPERSLRKAEKIKPPSWFARLGDSLTEGVGGGEPGPIDLLLAAPGINILEDFFHGIPTALKGLLKAKGQGYSKGALHVAKDPGHAAMFAANPNPGAFAPGFDQLSAWEDPDRWEEFRAMMALKMALQGQSPNRVLQELRPNLLPVRVQHSQRSLDLTGPPLPHDDLGDLERLIDRVPPSQSDAALAQLALKGNVGEWAIPGANIAQRGLTPSIPRQPTPDLIHQLESTPIPAPFRQAFLDDLERGSYDPSFAYYLLSREKGPFSHPGGLHESPFDAIRYLGSAHDPHAVSLALDPTRVELKTPWGVPVSQRQRR